MIDDELDSFARGLCYGLAFSSLLWALITLAIVYFLEA